VNLSTATKMCVNPPLAFLNGPTRSNPLVEKGQVNVWLEVDVTTHVSGEQKTGILHKSRQRSQHQKW
jgi:hypothetical protein